MSFKIWHQTPALLVFTLQDEIRQEDVDQLCAAIEERLESPRPFAILTYAHRATRFASPNVRDALLRHTARVRAVEHSRTTRTLVAHAVWLTPETMPVFSILQMQMGHRSVMEAFLSEESALAHLGYCKTESRVTKTWDFPFTNPEPGAPLSAG